MAGCSSVMLLEVFSVFHARLYSSLSLFFVLVFVLFVCPLNFLIQPVFHCTNANGDYLPILLPIWSWLSDCNWTRTHKYLVRKRTLNHLAKLSLQTKWLWVRVQLQSLKLQISRLFRVRISLTFRQL